VKRRPAFGSKAQRSFAGRRSKLAARTKANSLIFNTRFLAKMGNGVPSAAIAVGRAYIDICN